MFNKHRVMYVIRDTVSGGYVGTDSCRHMLTLVCNKQMAYKFSSEASAKRIVADEFCYDTARYRIETA